MTLSDDARKALGLLRELDDDGARARIGRRTRRPLTVADEALVQLEASGLADRHGSFAAVTPTGRAYPLDDLARFRMALDLVDYADADLDRARRARNVAAARLSGRLTLAELAELAEVSRERVRQWADEGRAELETEASS